MGCFIWYHSVHCHTCEIFYELPRKSTVITTDDNRYEATLSSAVTTSNDCVTSETKWRIAQWARATRGSFNGETLESMLEIYTDLGHDLNVQCRPVCKMTGRPHWRTKYAIHKLIRIVETRYVASPSQWKSLTNTCSRVSCPWIELCIDSNNP